MLNMVQHYLDSRPNPSPNDSPSFAGLTPTSKNKNRSNGGSRSPSGSLQGVWNDRSDAIRPETRGSPLPGNPEHGQETLGYTNVPVQGSSYSIPQPNLHSGITSLSHPQLQQQHHLIPSSHGNGHLHPSSTSTSNLVSSSNQSYPYYQSAQAGPGPSSIASSSPPHLRAQSNPHLQTQTITQTSNQVHSQTSEQPRHPSYNHPQSQPQSNLTPDPPSYKRKLTQSEEEGDELESDTQTQGQGQGQTQRQTQGDETKEVTGGPTFVACTKCRSRKIKCGGQKPSCLSCKKKDLDCCYDAVVKRRGPDKNPGGRVKNREAKEKGNKRFSTGASASVSFRGTSLNDSAGSEGEIGGRLGGTAYGWGVDMGHAGPQGQQWMNDQMVMHHPHSQNSHHPQHTQHPQRQQSYPLYDTAIQQPHTPVTPAMLNTPGSLPFNGMVNLASERPNFPPLTLDEARSVLGAGTNLPPQMISPNHLSSSKSWMTASPGNVSKLGVHNLVPGYQDLMNQTELMGRNIGEHEIVLDGRMEQLPPMPSLSLERLPDMAYARDSNWTWMTGLFSSNANQGLAMINQEIRDFFALNFSWFSFFNKSLFFNRLHHPQERLRIQPCLMLAMLAVVSLAKTSGVDPHGAGRKRSIMLADSARSMLHHSIATQSMDPSMAQAAMVLTTFEAYPHTVHSSTRFAAALTQLDTIIHAFQLIAVDVNDHRASIFIPNQVPLVADENGDPLPVRPPVADTGSADTPNGPVRLFSRWAPEPEWPIEWSVAQIKQDENRRMCWIASSVAGHFSQFQCAIAQKPIDLYLSKPENYAMFFIAEPLLVDSQPEAGKCTIWALFNRVTLLWHYVSNARYHQEHSAQEKLMMAVEVWKEADRIEKAMFHVEMDGGRSMKWQATDWLLNLRLLATDNFRMLPAMFGNRATELSREFARRWLATQANVAKTLMAPVSAGAKRDIPNIEPRSFFVWSLLTQVNTAIELYQQDPSLFEALNVAELLLRHVTTVSQTWPSETLINYLEHFRIKFQHAAQPKFPMLA